MKGKTGKGMKMDMDRDCRASGGAVHSKGKMGWAAGEIHSVGKKGSNLNGRTTPKICGMGVGSPMSKASGGKMPRGNPAKDK